MASMINNIKGIFFFDEKTLKEIPISESSTKQGIIILAISMLVSVLAYLDILAMMAKNIFEIAVLIFAIIFLVIIFGSIPFYSYMANRYFEETLTPIQAFRLVSFVELWKIVILLAEWLVVHFIPLSDDILSTGELILGFVAFCITAHIFSIGLCKTNKYRSKYPFKFSAIALLKMNIVLAGLCFLLVIAGMVLLFLIVLLGLYPGI